MLAYRPVTLCTLSRGAHMSSVQTLTVTLGHSLATADSGRQWVGAEWGVVERIREYDTAGNMMEQVA